ncbi:MAG TPA: carboxypeptidase regulatory-like domain-containing protein, partial [Pyrinomonadaceae bacterium]|nr:carboxypeptidase regulatory-like domain-containing protein [Pyrinomonadaceae bacterium]
MLLLLGIFITMLGPGIKATEPSHLFVQQGFLNSISGHVSDGRGAIPNLQVELLNDMDSVIQRTKTDSSGLFAFRRLSIGIFQVRVQTYGTSYIGQTKRVQLERTRAFEQVDFVLVSNQTSSISPTGGAVFVQEVPEQARREFDRGSDLLKNDRRNEGVAALRKAVEIFPSYFAALELLGMEYVKQQEYEPAIGVLTKAVEVN